MRYLRWLQEQQFDHPAHQIALQEMVEAIRVGRKRADRLERADRRICRGLASGAARAGASNVDLIVAVTFVTEVGDVSRFARPRQLIGFLDLVKSKRSCENPLGRRYHQGRKRPCSPHIGRERLDISTPAENRRQSYTGSIRHRQLWERSRVESSEPPDGPPIGSWARQTNDGGLHFHHP